MSLGFAKLAPSDHPSSPVAKCVLTTSLTPDLLHPRSLKTSSPKSSSPQTPPRALAQDGSRDRRSQQQHSPASPALSSASTADGEASPELPPLPVPRLPERVLGLLRTPPTQSDQAPRDDTAQHDPTQWGSPYPRHLRDRSLSSSSESSEESPIIQLELQTRFLRPAPLIQDSQPEPESSSSISAAAAVLAYRARRVAHGITEDWIRQHTAGGSDLEKRHWLSDGTGDSENSSLSGSFSGEEAAWLGFADHPTPRASRQKKTSRKASRNRPRKQSSSETLKALLSQKEEDTRAKMASSDERTSLDSENPPSAFGEPLSTTERPGTPGATGPKGDVPAPSTPSRVVKKLPLNTTPRLKKKVPWKGKNIMVLLPRDDERGQPGKGVVPLSESAVNGMLRSWEQLGYNVNGFDLGQPAEVFSPEEQSQSRGAWPDFDDLITERKNGNWRVLLPDLNGKTLVQCDVQDELD